MGNKSGKEDGPISLEDVAKRSGFSQEEFNEWTDIFKTHSGQKDYLTEEEFADVYSMAFTGDPKPFIKHLFRSFDSNKDGVVDYKEFLTGIACSTSENMKTKLKWAFGVYDVDGDGLITKQETMCIVRAMKRMTGQDPSSVEVQRTVNEMFMNIDTDSNSVITWSEFYKGVQNDPRLLEVLDCEPQTL